MRSPFFNILLWFNYISRNVYLDTSYVMGHIPEALLRDILLGHRPDRLLFGSDTPWMDQRESLLWVKGAGLPPERLQLLLGANAVELLKL